MKTRSATRKEKLDMANKKKPYQVNRRYNNLRSGGREPMVVIDHKTTVKIEPHFLKKEEIKVKLEVKAIYTLTLNTTDSPAFFFVFFKKIKKYLIVKKTNTARLLIINMYRRPNAS